MSFSANTLNAAREALVVAAQQKLALIAQLTEQGRKIVDLEAEVQKQADDAERARQALADARGEIEALRSQLPDDAAIRAYNGLTEILTTPAAERFGLRIAA